jgi:hypothetical protein
MQAAGSMGSSYGSAGLAPVGQGGASMMAPPSFYTPTNQYGGF